MKFNVLVQSAVLGLLSVSVVFAGGFARDLRTRGYSLIPAPHSVTLDDRDITVDGSWDVVSEAGEEHIAARRLVSGASELHGLEFEGTGADKLVLRLESEPVGGAVKPALAEQAYRLTMKPGEIEIAANAGAGLFYGAQSVLQLLRADGPGRWTLPAGVITDWPALELRFVHWDVKHQQPRLETLKRYIDWAAFFKANAIGFEMEDKYEYPSHPVIGVPGAYTKEQMRELTAYALERFVQLVPQIQSPAHMAYVLKHEEFAHLRADGSNYQACLCDEEAVRLMEDMYQDMIDATPGVEYFHVSTDEVYYAGICDKCQEQRPFNDENRSLTWAGFVNRMHDWLAARGRKMLCWVEYPLLPEHVERLPEGLINGVIGANSSPDWIQALNEAGVSSLVYSSQQGGELLFPALLSSDTAYPGRPIEGRLRDPAENVAATLATEADVIGTFAAAWGDAGLHSETFWPGWAIVTQYGWTPDSPDLEQSIADFMDIFYGPGNQDMVEVYRTLMDGARFYEEAWDRVPATRLKPSYGSWAGKGRGTMRIDLTLTPPALPFGYDEEVITEDRFSRLYEEALSDAPAMRRRIREAIATLQGKLVLSRRNPYNLEVLLSIAHFEKHFLDMMLELKRAEEALLEASRAQQERRLSDAHSELRRAHRIVAATLEERASVFDRLRTVWDKGLLPKGRSVDGRQFVHVLDDLKDHPADRRAGLDYLLEPFENIGLEQWNQDLEDFIANYAENYLSADQQ